MHSLRIKAPKLLGENVSALLRARGQTQHDLAQWCHKTDVWVSQFLNGKRLWQLDDLDRIADFFGIATYQLFQPGISPLTERRSKLERRTGRERRVGHAHRLMLGLQNYLGPYRNRTASASEEPSHGPDPARILEEVKRLTIDHERKISALLSQIESGGQAADFGPPLTKTRKGRRAAGGSDAAKA